MLTPVPFDRGKVVSSLSHLALMQPHWQTHQGLIKQALGIHLYLTESLGLLLPICGSLLPHGE